MTGDGQPSIVLVAVLPQETVQAFSRHFVHMKQNDKFGHMGWGLDSHDKGRIQTLFINSVLIPEIEIQVKHQPADGQTKGL